MIVISLVIVMECSSNNQGREGENLGVDVSGHVTCLRPPQQTRKRQRSKRTDRCLRCLTFKFPDVNPLLRIILQAAISISGSADNNTPQHPAARCWAPVITARSQATNPTQSTQQSSYEHEAFLNQG